MQLRFDVRNSPSLPDDVRRWLMHLAGKQMTDESVLIITAQQYRSQDRNRQDALRRLVDLIRRAAEKPKPRYKTQPTQASKARRLESKRRQSAIKRLRHDVPRAED